MADFEREVPDEITCNAQIFDIAFHPVQTSIIAASLIDGTVEIWRYGIDDNANQLQTSMNHHSASCRGLQFHSSGNYLYSISADHSWLVMDEHGKVASKKKNAHATALNKLMLIDENVFVTGDDSGVVKLWDIRTKDNELMMWDAHEDFIADFDYWADSHTIVSASGDATLGIYDIRKQEHFYRSDDQESELTSACVVKGGRKVVAGTQDGVMLLFNWGQWGDCSDRFPGHPDSVSCMLKYDESSVITGSSDGMIRVLSVLPNKLLGILGSHDEFPVEGLKLNHDKMLMASISHDEGIRFWDVSILHDEDAEEDDEADMMDADDDDGAKNSEMAENTGEKGVKETDDGDNIDDDEDDEDVEEEDEEDEDEEMAEDSSEDDSDDDDSPQKEAKIKKLQTPQEKFYSDL